MATITIDYSKKSHVPAIEAMLEGVTANDCDWNGAEFAVELGDFTSIECDDEIAGAALMVQVAHMLDSDIVIESTEIYWDSQDAHNPGWAYRSIDCVGGEESGEVNGLASDALDALSAGDTPTAAQLDALRYEFHTATLENVGEIFPGE